MLSLDFYLSHKGVMNMEKIIYNMKFRPTGIRNYWVSEKGDVINLDFKNPKIMKQDLTNVGGYARVELKVEKGSPKKFLIHRLVYQAFIGELKDGMVIEHLDGNCRNNHYTNLKQSTQKTNIETAIKHGSFGSNNKKTLLLYDKQLKKEVKFDKVKDVIEYLGLSIKNGSMTKLKKHSTFKNRFDIIEVKKSSQTIETVA